MEENYLKYKNEQLDIKVEIATPENWEAYKELMFDAITGDKKEMFRSTPEKVTIVQNKKENEWKADLSNDNMFIVLSWNGSEAVGMGSARKKDETQGLWNMSHGYVKKDFRNKDIGNKMFKARLDEIIKRGGKKVFLGIEANNENSIHIAEKFGFKKIIKPEDSPGSGHYMELDLTTKRA